MKNRLIKLVTNIVNVLSPSPLERVGVRIVLILLLTFWDGGEGYAQINLVPNWSFEEYNSCPNTYSPDCNSNPFLPTVKDWYCTFDVYSSPDYFNGCSTLNYNFKNVKGFQKPRTGLGYVGGLMNVLSNQLFDNIEYIQCTLRDSLKPNVNYCVQFFVSRTSFSAFALSQYGAVFTNNRLLLNGSGSPKFINLVPQVKNPLGSFIKDTLNWTKVEGSFLSTGSEHFMTLGCFGTQSLTDTLYDQLTTNPNDRYYPPYYYLDDVSVELVTKAQAGRDTVINCGGIASLGADSAIGATYKWFSKTGLNFDTVAFPLATPTITTKYVLQKTQCHIITYDTVKVTVTNSCPYINTVDEFIIPNVFTPNGDGINDVWQVNMGFGNIITDFNVYNRWGNIIQTTSLKNQTTMLWDGHTTSGEECSGGVYFYTLQYTNVLGEQKKVNGYVTLIK